LIEGKHLYGGREKKDQPPFNQQEEEHLSSPKNLLIKKSQKGWGKVLRDVSYTNNFFVYLDQSFSWLTNNPSIISPWIREMGRKW